MLRNCDPEEYEWCIVWHTDNETRIHWCVSRVEAAMRGTELLNDNLVREVFIMQCKEQWP